MTFIFKDVILDIYLYCKAAQETEICIAVLKLPLHRGSN